ncbi:MAG: WecB/TagA/CpsF family glycosyltransferase [Treponema sp.]|jgi:N-acetylglucosaminyldiphosphoundecaprenol N-acetyl-beta-D-mannosaminyltransferase|nr:WecB/TagA/CpsF family glycosyltransferase [Treponema sp.]
MSLKRISVIGVPVDVCPPEELEKEILEILAKPGTKQIVFLSIWKLLKATHKGDMADCVKNADLIIPISKSILRGAKFLKKEVPNRYNPFEMVIRVLSILESHFKTTYLLGSYKKTLVKAENNIRDTFPSLRIVGRYVGYYPKQIENDIISAIFKSQPSLVLISDGIKEKDCWAYKRRNRFSSSIFLYYKDSFGIFSERVKRIDEKTFNKGNEFWIELFHNPFKIFLIFPLLWYLILLVFYKLFRK